MAGSKYLSWAKRRKGRGKECCAIYQTTADVQYYYGDVLELVLIPGHISGKYLTADCTIASEIELTV